MQVSIVHNATSEAIRAGKMASIIAEHLTINQAERVFFASTDPPRPALTLVNSIRRAITTAQAYPHTYTSSYSADFNSSATVFQTAGSGSHYLVADSVGSVALRNAGTTAIDSTLLADLKKRTTYPPQIVSEDVSNWWTGWGSGGDNHRDAKRPSTQTTAV